MSLYDTGVGRKPPLSSNQLPQPTAYTDYSNNNNNEYPPAPPNQLVQPTNEVVIVHIIPNNNSTINQIGCIILSSDLREKESFSFNFTHDSFSSQAEYIHSSLNHRIWIITDDYPAPQILDNSFKALNKSSPQPQRIMSATQIFNNYKVFTSQSITASCNARIGCIEMYSALQRIALHNLLSPPSANVSTQTMQSVMERSSDFNTTIETQEVGLNDTNEWNTNNNNDILDDIINNELNNESYNNTQFSINEERERAQQTLEEQQAPIMQQREDETQATKVEEYDENNQQINGFHDEEQNETQTIDTNEAQSQTQAEDTQQDDTQQYIQEIDINNEQRSVQEDIEEQRSTKSEAFGHPSSISQSQSQSQSPSLQEPQRQPPSSWAAKFKTKTSLSSPKRRGVQVRDHVSDNIYGGKQRGKYAATKSADGIRNSIDAAIKKKDIIWVSYNGHQKPFIPRAIRPQSWDNGTKQKELSFFAIQHKSKSQTKQRFYLKNVLEVRDGQWRISNVELEQLKKRYNPYNSYKQNQNDSNYARRGYGTNKNFQNKRPRAYNSNNQ